jgi:hypothetical protein
MLNRLKYFLFGDSDEAPKEVLENILTKKKPVKILEEGSLEEVELLVKAPHLQDIL